MSNKYEITLIYSPDLGKDAVEKELGKVQTLLGAHQGKVISREDIGQKELSYPMDKKTHGIYILLVIEAAGTFVAEFNRQTRIDTNIVRTMLVKKDQYAPDYVAPTEEEEELPESSDGYDNNRQSA